MAGPAYVKFSCIHIMGITNPYITHCTLKSIFKSRNPLSICKFIFHIIYQMYYSTYANVYIFQTYHSMKCYKDVSSLKMLNHLSSLMLMIKILPI